MPLAVLSVDLVAKLASLEAGFDKSYRLAERNARNIEARYQRISSTFKALGGTIAASFAGVSLARVFDGVIENVDRLNDVKDATGSTIENLSGLEDLARRNNVAFETWSNGLVKFNQILGDATPGSKQAEILKSIGLNAEELRRIDPAEAFRQMAVALSKYEDNGKRARIVQELFGKSTKEVAAFLKDLATQTKLVGTVTDEEAEAAERYGKELANIGRNAENAARKLIGELLPALNQVLAGFSKGGLKGGINAFGEAIGFGQEYFDRLNIEKARSRIRSLEDTVRDPSFFDRATGLVETYRKELEKERAELVKLERAYLRLTDGAAGGGRGFVNRPFTPGGLLQAPDLPDPKPPKPPVARREVIDASREALARYVEEQQRGVESIQDQIDKLQELSNVEQALIQLRDLGGVGEVSQVRDVVLGLAQKRDALENELDLQRQLKDIEKQRVEAQRQLDDRLDELSGRVGDDLKRQLTARLEQRLNAGEVFSPEELDRIVRGIGGVNEELQKTTDIASELGLSFSSAFEDAIVNGEKLSEVLKGLEQDILRIITRKLVTEPLGNAITGILQGATSGGGNFLSSLFAGFFATGGYIPPGQWGIAGERGPEPVYGGRTGLTVQPSAQRGAPVTINVNVPQGTSRASAMQIGARAMSELQRAQRNM